LRSNKKVINSKKSYKITIKITPETKLMPIHRLALHYLPHKVRLRSVWHWYCWRYWSSVRLTVNRL